MDKKQNFLHHKEKHRNTKGSYTDESKSIEKKVGFTAVFMVITRRRILLEEASIYTAKMTAIK